MVIFSRSGAEAVELAALEMPCTRKGTVGSNPTRSAVLRPAGLPAQAGYGRQAILRGKAADGRPSYAARRLTAGHPTMQGG